MGDRSLILKVEDETLVRLETLAHQSGRSSEQLAEEAVKQYVEYESWKADKIRNAVRHADSGHFASDEEMEDVFDRYASAGPE